MAKSLERKVGFFFLVGIVVLTIMLEIGEKWNPFAVQNKYKTYLSSITGLKVGDPVRLAGVDVGRIGDISIQNDKVLIDFNVKPGTRIKTDSTASIRLTNMLGGQFLGLTLGSPDAQLLPPGGTVQGKDTASIDNIVDHVSELAKDTKVFINSLNKNQEEVMGKMSAILDENRGNLRGAVSNLNSITGKLDRGDGSLAMLLNDKTLYRNANEATKSLKNIAGKIDRGEGSIGKLVNDDAFYKDARGAVAGLNDSMKDVREIAAKINSGKGTMGKLVNEDTLYRDATATLKKTEKAMEGLGDSGPISVLGTVIGTLF